MKSIFGSALQLSLFGESHSPEIGVVLNGLAPGIHLDLAQIQQELNKRRAYGKISTQRQEADRFKILSGYFQDHTTGTPLCLTIANQVQISGDYEKNKHLPRPSHADYTAYEKYFGFQDYRGGGHFSGRLTAPIVAAGAICKQILGAKAITVGAHIQELAGIEDDDFSQEPTALAQQIQQLANSSFPDLPVLNAQSNQSMRQHIEAVAQEGDSVGGILEVAVCNMPPGIGEPFFDSIESKLSQLIFAIPAVKGIEFGLGFGFANQTGSNANDSFYLDEQTGQVKTATNHNGGINGGISNGMPLCFRVVVKATPSIYQPQLTVDLLQKKNSEILITGRHDPAIIHRARVVVEAMTAIGLVDLFSERYGYLWQQQN